MFPWMNPNSGRKQNPSAYDVTQLCPCYQQTISCLEQEIAKLRSAPQPLDEGPSLRKEIADLRRDREDFKGRLSAPINYESTVSNVVSYSPTMTRTHVASYSPAMTSTKVASYNPGMTRSQTISYTPAVSRAQASSYSIPAVTRTYVGTGGHKNSYHQASYRPGYCRRYHNKYRCKLFLYLLQDIVEVFFILLHK
ncbi:unnamed protein product [Mytilus edulis]|uniref:Uncharacterized protein n=1 Tax=Mytilus edulis TaxID=6550 RepID=A0A8S3T0Z7_MYTED|nr:unnamed protein product [Mytilus edulis]